MDINFEYAAHQSALMRADSAPSAELRGHHVATASRIARQIGLFQRSLGAAAASAWGTGPLLAAD